MFIGIVAVWLIFIKYNIFVYDYINVILVAMRLALTKSKSMHYLMKTFMHFKQQLDISKALKAEKAISMHDINSLESS